MWTGMLEHAHPRTLKRTAHRFQELAECYADLPFAGLLLEMRANNNRTFKTEYYFLLRLLSLVMIFCSFVM